MEKTKKYKAYFLFIALAFLLMSCFNNVMGQEEITIGPEYTSDLLLSDLGNPKGRNFEFGMPLSESSVYKGDDSTLDPKKPIHSSRKIFVYIPDTYIDGTEAPVLITLDGPAHFHQIKNALDNLSVSNNTKQKLPAFILVSVENGGGNAKGSQRGLEYDTMSDRFARFINDEVLPTVLNNCEIREAYPEIGITSDPWGRAVMGCSSGGAAAFTMAWFRPDLFRRVISYSGTFVDQQDDDAIEEKLYPLGAWEYHSGMKLIEKSDKNPIRIFLHVSENDLRFGAAAETYHNWVLANQRMVKVLKSKAYDYKYCYSLNSGHCDSRVFMQSLANTLLWIWKDYE